MQEIESFDWATPLKEIPVKEWEDLHVAVEEPHISSDGETVASIVHTNDEMFTVCENGQLWQTAYEKAWGLAPLPNGKFAACVCSDEEWTLCVSGREWENRFDFIWNFTASADAAHLGLAVQKDMEYGMAVNDEAWENMFESICEMKMGRAGRTAAVVQVLPMAAADIDVFSNGIFSCAVNGTPLDARFMNIWDIGFDSGGENVTYAVRFNRSDYGVAVNEKTWDNRFQSVWKPEFLPHEKTIVAPVRVGGKWFLYQDDRPLWENSYHQLWKLKINPATKDIAAIVSAKFGKWTVAENDIPWPIEADQMISDIDYSPDGSALMAVVKSNGFWNLAVNQALWDLKADKLFGPVCNEDASVVSAVVKQQGKYFLVVNNRVVTDGYDYMGMPVVHPDGSKILVKSISDGMYRRQVMPLDKLV